MLACADQGACSYNGGCSKMSSSPLPFAVSTAFVGRGWLPQEMLHVLGHLSAKEAFVLPGSVYLAIRSISRALCLGATCWLWHGSVSPALCVGPSLGSGQYSLFTSCMHSSHVLCGLRRSFILSTFIYWAVCWLGKRFHSPAAFCGQFFVVVVVDVSNSRK